MKLALLFDHFGPYHQARLRAAADKIETVGVEFHARSHDYAWDVDNTRAAPVETVQAAGDAKSFKHSLEAKLDLLQPDVVAIPGWSSFESLTALNWCLGQKVPAIVMSESSSHDEPRRAWKEWIKRRLMRLFSAGLVGGTAHHAYLARLGMQPDRIFLGYDAVDNDYFRKQSALARDASTERGDRGIRPSFLASARFIEKKNLPVLLQAFAKYRQLAAGFPSAECWPLTLLGDGPLRMELEGLVRDLALSDLVTMPGFKQYHELPAYYARASAFVHASTTEQWGLVVNEAMASGLPVLVSDRCGSAQDLVAEGVNGFTFSPFCVDDIARTLLRISITPDKIRKTMGAESQRIIAGWGPKRFGLGLATAASAALRSGARRSTLLDKCLLAALMRR